MSGCVRAGEEVEEGVGRESSLRFRVSVIDSLHKQPMTGRLFLALGTDPDIEPRIAAYNSSRQRNGRVPFFGLDVEALEPGDTVTVDGEALGYPYARLGDLPAGDYHAQALLHIYTRFERSDGHVIWAPMDHWDGQRWGFSPGNLYSEVRDIRVVPGEDRTVELTLARTIPPIELPEDTEWVKRVKLQSDLLTKFWGRPIHLGATLLLPRGYEEELGRRYPVVYVQNHFSLEPAFGFTTEPPEGGAELFSQMRREGGGQRESGYEFYRSWSSEGFPRVIAVTFQHPTPFFDDSYAVNSANNGPYGDALLGELIPHLEENFRIIAEPWARVLTGGSTGGWESLALQVHHPEFFGGTWTFYPDPVDFRRYQLVNIYDDENAFLVPGAGAWMPERAFQRTPDGQPMATVRQNSQLEAALGSRGRSGAQIDAWNAAYGPVGEDGYPRRLWDLETGEIDHEVAEYMRDHGYDLRHYLEQNWAEIGPRLVGKIRIYNPEMDHYYLSPAVYLLEDFLESTRNPSYSGEVIHGRPMKGHGWQPMTQADLVREMAAHMEARMPAGVAFGRRVRTGAENVRPRRRRGLTAGGRRSPTRSAASNTRPYRARALGVRDFSLSSITNTMAQTPRLQEIEP